LIEESLLSASQKEKIIESIQKQQMAQQQMAQAALKPPVPTGAPEGMPA
jgi:hypothetical protein